MPPKKKQDQANKKTQDKQKQKVIEDKTFGLKNKKGSKQQKFIKTVQSQVKYGGNPSARKLEQMKEAEKASKKDSKDKKLEELNMLFRPVQQQQKVSAGADPKSVLCAFFKQGSCGKGNKCKFSHDLGVERKGEKRSMYVDKRDDEDEETMEDWDQDKLEEVVKKKHGEAEKKKPKTEIICKHFLEAIDKGLYGWFWSCPAGDKCIYRHALPPGFVLKKKEMQKKDEEDISLEELIEKERANLSGNLTPVTLESFKEWKTKKVIYDNIKPMKHTIKEKKENLEREINKKKEDFKLGKSLGKISGREMFLFKPELADDDDDEATDDLSLYKRQEDDDVPVATLTLEDLAESAQQNAVGGTKVGTLSAKDRETAHAAPCSSVPGDSNLANGLAPADLNGLEQACAASDDDNDEDKTTDKIVLDGVPVEESLFEDDVDDLELEELEIVE